MNIIDDLTEVKEILTEAKETEDFEQIDNAIEYITDMILAYSENSKVKVSTRYNKSNEPDIENEDDTE